MLLWVYWASPDTNGSSDLTCHFLIFSISMLIRITKALPGSPGNPPVPSAHPYTDLLSETYFFLWA